MKQQQCIYKLVEIHCNNHVWIENEKENKLKKKKHKNFYKKKNKKINQNEL